MAKIASFVQKIFGKDASNIGQVGSAAAGTKVITNDPATIQSLTAFTNGISDVTLTSKRIIPQEEFMALHYLHTLQNAYTQQEGIQEYNSGVTYYTNSIVKKSGTFEIYGSLIDENIGNALPSAVSDSNWKYLGNLSYLNGFGSSLGTIGYQKLPSGYIRQWGKVLVPNATSLSITFPQAFPNALFGLSALGSNTISQGYWSWLNYGGTPTTTGFQLDNCWADGSGVETNAYWEAWGN